VYADANNWSNIGNTALHSDAYNVTSSVKIATVTYQGIASSAIGNAGTTLNGNQFSLFRSVFSSVVKANTLPGSGYSTQILSPSAVVGGYTFTASNQGDATVNYLQIKWFVNGVTSRATSVPYIIYATNPSNTGTLGDIVATGTTAFTGSNNAYSGTIATVGLNVPGGVGTDGVKVSAGTAGARTFSVQLDLSSFSPAANISSRSVTTQLMSWTWNDLTRGLTTPVAADPSMIVAPISGVSINQ
jgi:hypothetical protein